MWWTWTWGVGGWFEVGRWDEACKLWGEVELWSWEAAGLRWLRKLVGWKSGRRRCSKSRWQTLKLREVKEIVRDKRSSLEG